MATESANAAGAGARKPVVVAAAAAPVGFMDDDEGLCELLYRHFCFWRCERDYCFAEGSKCARARRVLLAVSGVGEDVAVWDVSGARDRVVRG